MSKLDEIRALRERRHAGSIRRADPKPVAKQQPRQQRKRQEKPIAASPRIGRPRREEAANTIEAQKPWIAEGVSRATWYRLRRRKK